jgi:hypothetical protein
MANEIRKQGTIQTLLPLRGAYQTWCEQCLEVVRALTTESATTVLQLTAGTFTELLESGKVHAVEVGTRSSLICWNSIFRSRGSRPVESEPSA